MSSHSSDGILRLRLTALLQKLAQSDPDLRISATGIGQQLETDPERVAPILVDWVRDGLLEDIIVERCDDGHLAPGLLREGEDSAEAYCHYCGGRTTIGKYVVYKFTPAFTEEVARQRHPKVLRRAAPMLSTLGRALVKFRRSPPRILHRQS